MPRRFSRLPLFALAGLLLLATHASVAHAQRQPTKDEGIRNRWTDCVVGSFNRQLSIVGDKYLAGENAINACKTERKEWVRVLVQEMGVTPPEVVTGAADSIEYDMKNDLIRKAR
ncbi:hypothetical protein [Methylorubrum aminovorans]|uniref:hypothetical protein n=1 Tax=Methylorubrum aminovorans TaxID=269069 RepID=UPI003C2D9E5A